MVLGKALFYRSVAGVFSSIFSDKKPYERKGTKSKTTKKRS